MAYSTYDKTRPDGARTGVQLPGDQRVNNEALRDAILMGQMQGFAYSVSGGTAEEPQYLYWKNSADWLRATLAWSGGKISTIDWHRSTNSGGAWDAIGSQAAFTYDGSGNLTAVSNTSGFISFIAYLLGKVKALLTSYTTHAAYVVADAVHGLGTIASQAANNVAISGGAINGTSIGATTRAAIAGKTYRGEVVALGSITGSTAVDWNAGDYFTLTCGGAGATLTWSNLPNGVVQGITLEVVNPGVATTLFPGSPKYPGGVAPTRTASGTDVFECWCRDGSAVNIVQAVKDLK